MFWNKALLIAVFLSTFSLNFSREVGAAEYGRGDGGCRRGDRLRIQDLDMSPDPIFEGRLVRSWRIRLGLEGRRDCDTDIFIREGNNLVGQLRHFRLHPGMNEIEVPPTEGFRFRGREMCFNVQVDLEGSRQQIDADRRFCATQRTVWSLREPEDRRRVQQ